MLHHSLSGFARSPRIVVGVAKNSVVAKLARTRLETLNHFGEEWILDVRNNDAQRAAFARSQVARVNVRKITKTLNRCQNQPVRTWSDFASFVQYVGDRGG